VVLALLVGTPGCQTAQDWKAMSGAVPYPEVKPDPDADYVYITGGNWIQYRVNRNDPNASPERFMCDSGKFAHYWHKVPKQVPTDLTPEVKAAPGAKYTYFYFETGSRKGVGRIDTNQANPVPEFYQAFLGTLEPRFWWHKTTP
jgi:hypothetical protein